MDGKYILRFDDISWDMNYENFSCVRDLMIKYNVKPIIGVIPHNEDEKLKSKVKSIHISEQDFWIEISTLQNQHGWAIALHGYNHVYVTEDSGIFGINKRAEFAGLPLSQQTEKIMMGKEIFEKNGIRIDAFMAPAHSLDWNTVKALTENGICTVTDGCCAYPFIQKGVTFVPQVWPWPHKHRWGIDTACFHINDWDHVTICKLEAFLKKNSNDCVDFREAASEYSSRQSATLRFKNVLSVFFIMFKKKVRIIGSKIKRCYFFKKGAYKC